MPAIAVGVDSIGLGLNAIQRGLLPIIDRPLLARLGNTVKLDQVGAVPDTEVTV